MEELENRHGAPAPDQTAATVEETALHAASGAAENHEAEEAHAGSAAEDSRAALRVGAESEFDPDSLDEGDVLVAEAVTQASPAEDPRERLKAVIEAAIYITEEPLTAEQIAIAIEQPIEVVQEILARLAADYAVPSRGLTIRELAGGYKMSTKAEHHEDIRKFVRNLQPAFKLSLAALETLAVIAYKQPITGPEILDIRGVQGAGVLKTLLDRKLIATAGRKNVVGKPMLYKTTKEFLVQFGLSSLAELPTLKEFEELGRLALNDSDAPDEPQNAGTTGFGEEGSSDAVIRPDLEEALQEATTAEPTQEQSLSTEAHETPHAAEADHATHGEGKPEEAVQEVSQAHG